MYLCTHDRIEKCRSFLQQDPGTLGWARMSLQWDARYENTAV